MPWPDAPDEAAYDAFRRDEAALRPGLDAIVARHGLKGEPERFSAGSLPVWGVGSRVVKVFPPYDRAHWETEARTLAFLDGRLSLRSPSLEAVGEVDGWGYVVMERLPGRPLDGLWGDLPPEVRRDLARGVGAGMAELHALPPDGLPDDWDAFVAAQVAGCGDRQRTRRLAEPWAAQVDGFLARHPPLSAGRALLHTEIMPAHLLAEERDGAWRLTGWIDFEPSTVGDPEYDMASVGVFVAAGDPDVLAAVRSAWGRPSDPETPLQTMTWALLHRYSRLAWYLDLLPARPGVTTLEDLATQWFGDP